MAVVAVARKLVELVHRLLTREEDFLYRNPQRTMDKRSKLRQLAKKKIGVAIRSAAAKINGRPALYGAKLGIKGSSLKKEITRSAARQAERLYTAIVEQRAAHLKDPDTPLVASTDLVFDPTRPNRTDWEKILSQAAEKTLKQRGTKTA